MFAAFGFGGGGSTFAATYRVYPVSFLEKESAERGDKLILPPSALDRLGEFFFFQCFLFLPLACLLLSVPLVAPKPQTERCHGEADELFSSEETETREMKRKREKERRRK